MYNYNNNFQEREDLKVSFGDNALLMYALQLRYDIEDVISVASDALTDGHNDKKCDLIYIDRESGFVVIAQSYMKRNPKTTDLAPANKASDLNTASAWLFSRNIDDVPNQIKDSVRELQEAISAGEINSIYFWYVHNLNETNNKDVQEELDTVQITAQKLVDDYAPDMNIKVFAIEVGNLTIEKWYNSSTKRIEIEDELWVKTNKEGFEIAGDKWKAYVTAVSGKWLRELYLKYKEDELFSGNPRNFLGAGKRKNKINLGIMDTVEKSPENFWAYNNGITALVNSFHLSKEGKLKIKGITIINGAQTTGAIAAVDSLSSDFWVPIRFIVCNDKNTINEIVNNNNKQNEILPSDLRSNDKQQERLRKEFLKYSQLYYNGGRRDDKRPKNKEVFDPYVVAQTITAFHGDPVKAYNDRKALWDNEKDYNYIFSDQLKAEHIIFVYSLSRAIDEYKIMLKDKKETRTENENKQYGFMCKRGSKMLLIYAIAACLESIMAKKISSTWELEFKNNDDFDLLIAKWRLVVKSIISFSDCLGSALEGGLKNKDTARNAVNQLNSMTNAVQEMLHVQLKEFTDEVKS